VFYFIVVTSISWFGTTPGKAPGSQVSDTTKKAEELKRKARAERFGITQSTPAEGDEKKKARLSKFGSASTADPLEEEKKKARALRYLLNQQCWSLFFKISLCNYCQARIW
ncbi:hypothetical protein Tco_1042372, partial [Tanacetum coccineum]